jgi:hypothetical protein
VTAISARALRLAAGAAALAALAAPTAARAERAAGITGDNGLVTFDTLTPGTGAVKAITGLQTPTERVVALDTRPATGDLDALTVPLGVASNATVRLYRIDPYTAAATLIGNIPGTIPGAGDWATGADFNPLVDRLRVVQSDNENFRMNPNNGSLAGDDVNLTYTAPATGPVTGEAYDRNVAPGPPGTAAPPGARTTLYGIDTGAARLVVQGGLDGAGPGGPNGGAITAVGTLGVPVLSGSDAGFDISPTGAAFAALSPAAGASNLYGINLTTGAATLVGALPAVVTSLTILPPDNCPGVSGDDQADLDGDGLGDACDPDIDGDGLSNAAEQAIGSNPRSADSDGDGRPDGADACPTLAAATANGCPAAAPAPDRTAPSVAISRLASKLKFASFLKGVTFRVKPSEPSAFRVELIAKARKASIASSGDLVLATKSLKLGAGQRSVKLKPSRKLLGSKRKFRITVRVTATDAAGNRKVVSKTVRVTG